MQRRAYLRTILAAGTAAAGAGQENQQHIELHVDLSVEPAREKEFVGNFHTVFKPAARRQSGYIDARIIKLRSALAGNAPGEANYRFVLIFRSEELRRIWVASETHQKVWPELEKTLRHKNYTVLLFDLA